MVKDFSVKDATGQHANAGNNIPKADKVKIVACDGKTESKSECNAHFFLSVNACSLRRSHLFMKISIDLPVVYVSFFVV